jgi:protein-tyrosine phosphatase
MDRRAANALTAAGYDPTRHRARQYDDDWAREHDVVLAMDHENLADLGGRSERVAMFRDLDPVEPGADVPDPYYGGADGFADVLTIVERTSDVLVAELAELLRSGSSV